MMNKMITGISCTLLVLAMSSWAFAQDYQVAVPQLSPKATETYTTLIKAVVEATGNTATIQVVPFARCMFLIENKQADIVSANVQIPDKSKWAALTYDYSTQSIFTVAFVLYANKDKPIPADELKKGNPRAYKIETDLAHINHFGFSAKGSTNIADSLHKVDDGIIDGFIFSQGSTDPVLKQRGYKNVVRQNYDLFNAVFLLPKGARGGETDKMLSDGLAKIQANGKFKGIMGAYMAAASSYIEWKP